MMCAGLFIVVAGVQNAVLRPARAKALRLDIR